MPVFRWALEQWPPDTYHVVVFHRGPLADEADALVQELERGIGDAAAPANAVLRALDLDEALDPAAQALWTSFEEAQAPWLALTYPISSGIGKVVWSGPLTADAVKRILSSPRRKQILERLAAGDAAVWVLLESGDLARDDEAASVLRAGIEQGIPSDASPALSGGVKFSMIRVSRDEPAEEAFVNMLLYSEPDLEDLDAPMAFPVFGQGRALYALVGAGINAKTIADAQGFFVEACRCVVKAQNPGVDMLLAANWEALAGSESTVQAFSAAADADPSLSEPPKLPAQGAANTKALAAGVLGALAVALSGVGLVTFALIRRQTRPRNSGRAR